MSTRICEPIQTREKHRVRRLPADQFESPGVVQHEAAVEWTDDHGGWALCWSKIRLEGKNPHAVLGLDRLRAS